MDYFEKKQWIRLILCAVAVVAITLLVAGVIGGEPLTYNRTDTTLVTEKGTLCGKCAEKCPAKVITTTPV